MTEKLWGGRFSEKPDEFLEEFTASVDYDVRLYREDIEGSIAHARMLGETGVITKKESREIIRGLRQILREIEKGEFVPSRKDEDIHMNVEKRLHEIIGDLAGKLHTGRSRNDQVATDLRLHAARAIEDLVGLLGELKRSLVEKAYEYRNVVMPEYTHLQRAQPVLFAHHLLAYVEMLERDEERFLQAKERTLVLPLGSAACTGTSFPLDREMVRKELGFRSVSKNSVDAVSDRDFVAEFLFCVSLTMIHLSRLCEELVLWMSEEFGFIDLPDSLCTGSSIMPQKKNPDMAELVRGKAGRAVGNLVALLTTLKGLPLSYNRDLQEDKEPFFDSLDTLRGSLRAVKLMIEGLSLNVERIRESLPGGYLTATDLAEYLVKKGVPFRKAHEVTGKIVRYAVEGGKALEDLTLEEFKKFSRLIEEDVYRVVDPEESVKGKDLPGGTSPRRVMRRLRELRRKR
ncbi:MAG: argininosuccinate lyase [Deltaproteobacteria bacterium]|nr:MAG: argininosuccinate lyase [Deltaproteobacteria bacterium]